MLKEYKRIMLLDTSSSYLFINFIEDGKVVYQVLSEGKNNHSDNLLKDIEEGLKKLNLKVNDFDCFVCGVGPGMYTGLRVSMTVAKTFAWTLKKDLYVLSSIDLLFSDYIGTNKQCAIMLKAKKDYSYTKIVDFSKDYKVLRKEEFLSNEDFLKLSSNYQILNNDDIKIDALRIEDFMLTKVENIHALEPNYLRSDI